MKKSYIKPEAQLVFIGLKNSLLDSLGIYGDGASNGKRAVAMDANDSFFDEDDSWDASSNKSLWDD